MYLPVPGFEPTSSEFLDKCATRSVTVADNHITRDIVGVGATENDRRDQARN